jgi:hypothetical protein
MLTHWQAESSHPLQLLGVAGRATIEGHLVDENNDM